MDNDEYIIDISSITLGDTVTITESTVSPNLTWDTSWVVDTDNTIDLSNIIINEPVEFEDTMPDVAKVEDMCNNYPALAKAYENFKSIYKMVHQDWVGRQKDDELPF